MAVWYEMEKSEKGIENFLDSNWGFHDFRPEKIEYISGKDCVEIFLKYDTMDEGVLLRFAWIHNVHINPNRDYDGEWLSGCITLLLENNNIIWLADDEWGNQTREHLNEVKKYTTWVEAERIFWAITDADGNPVEMPQNRIHQIWNIYGKLEEKHFELQEFHGDWNLIMKPYYNRQLYIIDTNNDIQQKGA